MAELPVMPWFADAYLTDTRHLTLEEHGAYRLLLDIAWRSAGNTLPDNDKRLAQMLGISGARWAKLKPEVMAFWTLTANGWQQKKLCETFKNAQARRDKCAQAARVKWNAKSLKNNVASNADAYANAVANAHADADATINHNHEPAGKETPNGVSKKRGHRLPDNWGPGKEEIEFAQGLGMDMARIKDVADDFRDYWQAQPGQRGVKLDWLATWRRWCRNAGKQRNGHKQYVSASGFEYRGTPEQVLRKANERRDLDTAWRVRKDMDEAKSVGDLVKGFAGNA